MNTKSTEPDDVMRYEHNSNNIRAGMDHLAAAVKHLQNGGKVVVVLEPDAAQSTKSILKARFTGFLRQVKWETSNQSRSK